MLANTMYLTFHGIGAPIVPPAEGELRYFVTADVFRRTIAGLGELEAKTGVEAHVTFDDGNISDYEVALPTLVEHGRRGIFFVLAGRIGQHGYLSAAQIREMIRQTTGERKPASGRIALTDGRNFEFAAVPLPDGNALLIMLVGIWWRRRLRRASRPASSRQV